MFKCFIPNCKSPNGAPLYRVNAKGQPGVWACAQHVAQTDAKVDPAVRELVETLHDQQRGNP